MSTRIAAGDDLSDLWQGVEKNIRRGQILAERLKKIGNEKGAPIALFQAKKLCHCLEAQNVWIARDLNNDEGELFNWFGTYARCSLSYCPFCGPFKHRKTIKPLMKQIDSDRLLAEKSWYLITLTAPIVADQSLLTGIGVFQTAWSLLRKRKYWVNTVLGGIKSIEWTVPESSGGNHVHIHALICCNHNIDHPTLASIWTEAIYKAWQGEKVSLKFPTQSGFAVVDIKKLRVRKTPPAASTLADEIKNSLNYPTKGSAWNDLSDNDLLSMVEKKRLPRLVEVFGEFRTHPRSILDKNYISDGWSSHCIGRQARHRPPRQESLRERMRFMTQSEWQSQLANKVARDRECRRQFLHEYYPFATFHDLLEVPIDTTSADDRILVD